MAAQVQNGIEIEIIVRTRKDGKPVGESGHTYAIADGERAGRADRRRIADEVQARADEYLKSRLVGPAE